MKLEEDMNNEKEIDFNAIFRFFLRNKYIILSSSFVGLILSFFVQMFTPVFWKGEFQIVLNSRKKTQPEVSGILNLPINSDNDLKTQVEILSSPSVLLDIFEYVKKEKVLNDSSYENLSFLDWKENLDFELKGNTTVLNLSYKDKNREIILPVLEKISKKYISYTDEQKEKQIKQDLKFYEKQISFFKSKSIESLKAAQQFAIDNDLKFQLDKTFTKFDSVESIRVESLNKVRDLKEKLNKIKTISDESDELIFIADSRNSEFNVNRELLTKVNEIDKKIARRRLIYQYDDVAIKNLLTQKNEIKNALKKEIMGAINSEILNYESKALAYKRPKEILLKYSELSNQAQRDSNTLIFLEDELRKLSLNLSKKEYPWKMITNPSLFPNSFSSINKNIKFLFLLMGTIVGFAFSLLQENKKNIFYSVEDIENIFKYPILDELENTDPFNIEKSIKFISSNLQINSIEKFGIVFLGDINDGIIDIFKKYCDIYFKSKEISLNNDIKEAVNESYKLIVLDMKSTKKNDLYNLVKKIVSNKLSIIGLIVIK